MWNESQLYICRLGIESTDQPRLVQSCFLGTQGNRRLLLREAWTSSFRRDMVHKLRGHARFRSGQTHKMHTLRSRLTNTFLLRRGDILIRPLHAISWKPYLPSMVHRRQYRPNKYLAHNRHRNIRFQVDCTCQLDKKGMHAQNWRPEMLSKSLQDTESIRHTHLRY